VVLAYPSSRRHLAGGEAPSLGAGGALTVVGIDKTGSSGFRNFEQELPIPVRFMWQHKYMDQN
jgi:hypothetical protein